jgi:hypothetical protein
VNGNLIVNLPYARERRVSIAPNSRRFCRLGDDHHASGLGVRGLW